MTRELFERLKNSSKFGYLKLAICCASSDAKNIVGQYLSWESLKSIIINYPTFAFRIVSEWFASTVQFIALIVCTITLPVWPIIGFMIFFLRYLWFLLGPKKSTTLKKMEEYYIKKERVSEDQ